MTDKERLIELMIQCFKKCWQTKCTECNCFEIKTYDCRAKMFADHLIANNVVVQKQGEWIVHQDNDGTWHFDCPFCDDGYATKTNHAERFCSNCGAKMVKEDK